MILLALAACASGVQDSAPACADTLPALVGTVASADGNTNIGTTLTWSLDGGANEDAACTVPVSPTNCVSWEMGNEVGLYTLTASAPGYVTVTLTRTIEAMEADSRFIQSGLFQLTLDPVDESGS